MSPPVTAAVVQPGCMGLEAFLYDTGQCTCALLLRRDTREVPRSRRLELASALGLRRVHHHVMYRGQLRVLARVHHLLVAPVLQRPHAHPAGAPHAGGVRLHARARQALVLVHSLLQLLVLAARRGGGCGNPSPGANAGEQPYRHGARERWRFKPALQWCCAEWTLSVPLSMCVTPPSLGTVARGNHTGSRPANRRTFLSELVTAPPAGRW